MGFGIPFSNNFNDDVLKHLSSSYQSRKEPCTVWLSGEQPGIEMAQRGEAALPGLGVLLLVSQYLVFFFKPQLLESSNERKIH